MAYKWKPSKTQRREFAIRMQDPEEKVVYEARKEEKAKKRRAESQFDYESAGGYYIPTKHQHDQAHSMLFSAEVSPEQEEACYMVISGYVLKEKVFHDYIHVVNEFARNKT
jgi:hypothetical protein